MLCNLSLIFISHNQSWFQKKQSEVHTKYETKCHLLLPCHHVFPQSLALPQGNDIHINITKYVFTALYFS